MRIALAALVAATSVVAATAQATADIPEGARAGAPPERARHHAERQRQQQLDRLALRVSRARTATWSCQHDLGLRRARAAHPTQALPSGVAYRRWAARLWASRAARCAARRAALTIPLVDDWRAAVAAVQRVFPGTAGWLLSCSAGEGGHGGFVMNQQGSGAGGWMQFVYSTYVANADEAFAYARRMGFVLDPRANEWRHPLGQALTAAYMRSRGWSRWHWDPGIDPACA